MKQEKQSEDVKRLMEENSPKTTAISFLIAILYGIAALLTDMARREMIESIAIQIIYSKESEVSQYGGIKRIVQISTIVLMVILWISTFMIVRHKIERAGSLKTRVALGVK